MCHLNRDCMKTVIDFLRATRKLIEHPEAWTKDVDARDQRGPPGPEYRPLGGLLVPHGGTRCRGGDDGRRAGR